MRVERERECASRERREGVRVEKERIEKDCEYRKREQRERYI